MIKNKEILDLLEMKKYEASCDVTKCFEREKRNRMSYLQVLEIVTNGILNSKVLLVDPKSEK